MRRIRQLRIVTFVIVLATCTLVASGTTLLILGKVSFLQILAVNLIVAIIWAACAQGD